MNALVQAADGRIVVTLEGLSQGDRVTVKFRSSRNNRISRISDVSPQRPANSGTDGVSLVRELSVRDEAPPQTREMYFPVVDLALAKGDLKGVMTVAGATAITVNAWRDATVLLPANGTVHVPPAQLEQWENVALVVREPGPPLGPMSFHLQCRPEIADGRSVVEAAWLGHSWTGVVDVEVVEQAELQSRFAGSFAVGTTADRELKLKAMPNLLGGATFTLGTDVAALQADLELTLGFIERAENTHAGSLLHGGLSLFYDFEARTWRMPHWIWTYGPSIRVLLEAAALTDDAGKAERWRGLALRAGEASLRVFVDDETHPAKDLITVRWHPEWFFRNGFEQLASPPDALFLAGWGWGSLYQHLGDERFLAAMRRLTGAADRLARRDGIIPQDYLFKRGRWKERILDEAGFGTEGLAELHAITGDASLIGVTRNYIDQLLTHLERPDGLWNRFFWPETGAVTATEHNLRGMGWAMEGLLAAYRATRDERYLEKARQMATHLLHWQHEDGSWAFRFTQPVEQVGICEKGTTLWAVLLYRLYFITGERSYIEAADRAIAWARQQLRRDAHDEGSGGIISVSPHSGVVYRHWFPLAATYTAAFLSQGLLYQLHERRGRSREEALEQW